MSVHSSSLLDSPSRLLGTTCVGALGWYRHLSEDQAPWSRRAVDSPPPPARPGAALRSPCTNPMCADDRCRNTATLMQNCFRVDPFVPWGVVHRDTRNYVRCVGLDTQSQSVGCEPGLHLGSPCAPIMNKNRQTTSATRMALKTVVRETAQNRRGGVTPSLLEA